MSTLDGSGITISAKAALGEIEAVIAEIDRAGLRRLAEETDAAPRVFFAAGGRSLLILRAIAMRLMHIGLETHIVGDTTTPAVGPGDLVVVASARAGRAARATAVAAREAGARVVGVSASAEAFDGAAETVLCLPARTVVPTHQHAGSLFEQTLLVVGDAVTRSVQASRRATPSALEARHANL
ncbi:phosphoheptose isomerase family protein [Glycomyces xiaoerkulensis]|uniref:6-phospho-3-hexuloisomerase n=1 Tax=Glycomyces xiaoerkulensis TaxID=2038139 RepID=UPI0013000DCE|nr:6-phospho-3-hexuloisomerase [Glycomyces xiaoerkulensis]